MAIDYKKYGAFVRNKRKSMDYSQKEVYQLTGISVETQRLLENGHREPRLITLERLSDLYKSDLIFALYHSRSASDFFSEIFIETMWRNFNNGDYDGFIQALEDLVDSIKEDYMTDGRKSAKRLKFIESLEYFRDLNFEKHRYEMSSSVFYEQLLLFLSKNHLSPLSDQELYYIEIQVGILLSYIYRQREEFEASEAILQSILNTLENEQVLTHRQMDYLIVCYINLCLVYQWQDQYDRIIHTIKTLFARDDLKFKLFYYNELQFRLAIAYKKTKRPNYKNILAGLLLSETATRAGALYERLKSYYEIKAEAFMDMRDVSGFEDFYKDKDMPIWGEES